MAQSPFYFQWKMKKYSILRTQIDSRPKWPKALPFQSYNNLPKLVVPCCMMLSRHSQWHLAIKNNKKK